METKHRTILAIALGVIIIGVGIYAAMHWGDLFKNKVTIKYPDGCIEEYYDGVMQTPICSNGRMLEQERQHVPKGINTPAFPGFNGTG